VPTASAQISDLACNMEQTYNSCKQGILRDFNEKLFLKGRNVELIAEDDRLDTRHTNEFVL
jgi:hypothetical protein